MNTPTLAESAATVPAPGFSMRDLLGAHPGAILMLDVTGRVVHFNQSAERLTGFTSAALSGKHLVECGFLSQSAQAAAVSALLELLKGQPLEPVDLEALRPDGSNTWLQMSGAVIRHEGQIAAVLFVLTDVARQRLLEEKLRLSQKMEAVGRLATGLAHDYNNVLTVIKGYSEVLLLNSKLPPEALKQIRSMATAAERGANLTRQLLTFSRRHTIQPRHLDLNEVITSVTQMLRRLVNESITLQFRFAPAIPAINADLGMIEQLVSNFVLQARESMPSGGHMTIETGSVEVGSGAPPLHPEAREGRFVTLTVSDDGTTLALSDAQRLLATSESQPGPVSAPLIGLHVAQDIVRQHRGWIAIEASVPVGITYRIYLPASTQVAQPEPGVSPQAVAGGTEVVLVAEDEPSIRELAKAILIGHGYTVYEAGSGPEALAVWDQHGGKVDVLFTDMVMPGGMTGRVLAEQLEAKKPGLRVLYTTGYSLDLVQSNIALRPGFNLLPKPYNTSSLAQAIRKCLDRRDGPAGSP